MKVLWSEFASETLIAIYKYYKDIAGDKVARKIKTSIFHSTAQLINQPDSGQIEDSLKQLKEGHRYLVEGN